MGRQIEITEPRLTAEIEASRAICLEYAHSLDFDLCFQGFGAEIASFPGKYAADAGGCLLLALVDGEAEGMVALRDLGDDTCEMKRLYVRPGGRGLGLGRKLCERLRDEAIRLGYRAMRLDTVPGQHDAAIELYRALGFREIAPYCHNPVPGALFMEMRLRQDGNP